MKDNFSFANSIGKVTEIPKGKRYTKCLEKEYFVNNDIFKDIIQFKLTSHARSRCLERRITPELLKSTLKFGIKVWNSENNNSFRLYYRNPDFISTSKIVVAVICDNCIITVYKLHPEDVFKNVKNAFEDSFAFEDEEHNLDIFKVKTLFVSLKIKDS